MCMVYVDEALVAVGIAVAAAPWYRQVWGKVLMACKWRSTFGRTK